MAICLQPRIVAVVVIILLLWAVQRGSTAADCITQPIRKERCNRALSVATFTFFYNTTASECQAFDGCTKPVTGNNFGTIERCILECDPLGPGDRMALEWKSEFDCPNPDSPKIKPSVFELPSRDLIEAVINNDVMRLVRQVNSLPVVDVVTDERGWTMLHHAAYAGLFGVINQLIEVFGADLLARSKNLETPLHLAVRRDHYIAVKTIVETATKREILAGVINARDRCGFTPLHIAASTGNIEIAHFLRQNTADPLARSSTGKLPLHLARYYDIVDYLLVSIDDVPATLLQVNTPDNYGRTPLFYAGFKADNGGQLMVAGRLVDLGVDFLHRDAFGMTPLHFAIAKNDVNFTHFLMDRLQSGAVGEAQCCGAGRTVAHIAARFNSAEALEALMTRKGVRVNLTNSDWQGQDPYCIAVSNGNANFTQFLRRMEVRVTVSCHESYLSKVKSDRNALHLAVAKEEVDVVAFLLSKGASVAVQDEDGRTPLHLAIVQCKSLGEDIVNALLTSQMAVDSMLAGEGVLGIADLFGDSALSLAVRNNCPNLVGHFLNRYNANCKRLDRDGFTPLHLAKKLGYNSLVEAMISTGKCFPDATDVCGLTLEDVKNGRVSRCKLPPPVQNGVIEVTTLCMSAKAIITCHGGYRLRGSNVVQCDPNGEWPMAGYCEDARFCGDVPSIVNGVIENSMRPLSEIGTISKILCKDGYHVDGAPVARCDESARWVMDGRCVRGCKEPPPVENGTVSTSGPSSIGSWRKLTCNLGFIVNGSETVECSEEGLWRLNGHCVVEQCLDPIPKLLNGHISDGPSLVGAMRTAVCEVGYGLTGSKKVICGRDYKWHSPTCKKVKYAEELLDAAMGGDLKKIEQILFEKDADVNGKRNIDGWTAIIRAASHGHLDAVRFLMDRGGNFNVKANDGHTAMTWAAYYGYTEVVRFFLDLGADVNTKINDGDTALLLAARNDRPDVVRLLVEHGADLNVRDVDGYTPLIYAVCYAREEDVRFLIKHGADINVKNNEGKTALYYAYSNDFTTIAQLLSKSGAHTETIFRLFKASKK